MDASEMRRATATTAKPAEQEPEQPLRT
jgi:hypothetical protein